MNKLPLLKRIQILSMLVEGMSMRAVSRITDVSFNTVSKLMVEAGEACAEYHDKTVRDVNAVRVQCDEIWSFTYAKQKNVKLAKAAPEEAGDTWTWTALTPSCRKAQSPARTDMALSTSHRIAWAQTGLQTANVPVLFLSLQSNRIKLNFGSASV